MDGMVQGLTFDNGRADFRNRWVRTPKYQLEDRHNRGMFCWTDGDWTDWRNIGFGAAVPDEHTRGIPQGTNNINCFPFAGEILASGEQGSRRWPWIPSPCRPAVWSVVAAIVPRDLR